MSAICIIDTSVFCSILNVPNRNQHNSRAMAELRSHLQADYTLLLPLAAIFETGNHVAQNGSGQQRRGTAEVFVQQVRAAFTNEAPWTPTPMPAPEDVAAWIDGFPDHAMRGTGLGDLSIVKVWERQCELHRARRVFIWSYDRHLGGYDRPPLL